MKIIKKGTKKRELRWWAGAKLTCPDCETIFQLEGTELLRTNENQALAVCPVCSIGVLFSKFEK